MSTSDGPSTSATVTGSTSDHERDLEAAARALAATKKRGTTEAPLDELTLQDI